MYNEHIEVNHYLHKLLVVVAFKPMNMLVEIITLTIKQTLK